MAKSDSKTILKLMFLLFPILFVSCNNETNDTIADQRGNLLVNDFGVIKELTKEQYRPNMVIRYKKDGYTIAALKLDSFTSSIEKSVPSPKIWIDSTPYYYDRITTMDSGNVKVKIYNSHLRSVNGHLIYNPIRLLKQEINKGNLYNVLPGDGMIGKVDDNVVSFRVDMQEGSHDIHLKKGGYFSVSFQLPGNPFYHPDSLSMWHFDDTNDRWEFETFAHRNGDVYEADLNEFGWWTSFKSDCDFRKITIRMEDKHTLPLPYSNFSLISTSTKKRYDISTDAMGVGNFYLDTDDTYEVHMHGFSIASYDHDWPYPVSYTNIKYPRENDLIFNIGIGKDNQDFHLQIKEDLSSIYIKNGLPYDEIYPKQVARETSQEEKTIQCDDIEIVDEISANAELKYSKWISKAPDHKYPMSFLMPFTDSTSKIDYHQTLMSQWDTLQDLSLYGDNRFMRFIPYKTNDTILAEFSKEISSFSADTITDGIKELYHINNICVKRNEELTIKYITHGEYELEPFYKETFKNHSIDYHFYIKNKIKGNETKHPIRVKVSDGDNKAFKILSVKDMYNNDVLLDPENGAIYAKALTGNKLTFEFEGEDSIYNSTINITPQDYNSLDNSSKKDKALRGLIILFLLIFGPLYLKKKIIGHRETANFQDTKTYDYKYQDDGSTRYYTGNSLTPHINLALLIAKVINMGPSFDDRHEHLIWEFQKSIELKGDLVDWVKKCRFMQCDMGKVLPNLMPLPEKKRASLVKLLFQIANLDDGIKNDEWEFIDKVMIDLKISQKHIDALHRQYDPLGKRNSTHELLSDFAILIAKVINMGPSFDMRHKNLIWEFQLSFGLEGGLVDKVAKYRNKECDIDQVLSNLTQLPEKKRARNQTALSQTKKVSLVKLLFKIAVTDDGIKNDEWDFLNKVMRDLKISKPHIDALHRRYEPLRSERDSSHQSKSEESSRQYKANDSGEKTRNNKRNSSYKAKDEESSRQYKTNDSGKKTGNDKKQKTSYSPNAEYFAILGISDDSTIEEVKAAYRKLAKTWHPDFPKNANNIEECIRKMAEINIAYKEILKDLDK